MKKIVIYWIPVIFWSSIIFFISSIPDLKIEVLGIWDYVLRKIAHIVEYFILTILYFRALKNTTKLNSFSLFFWSIFLSFVYAIGDEIHQHYVPGRHSSVTDVCIDSIGIILGAIFSYKLKLLTIGLKK